MMKLYLLIKKSFLVVLLIIGTHAIAQNVTVTGKVIADDGTALPGVSILIKGSNTGAATDADGKFNLAVPSDGLLVVSFIGYQTQEVPVSGRTTLDIILKSDVTELSEVI